MARDEAMHLLLLDWAQWVMVGNGSGYPTMSVIHPDWSPPSPGVTPTMKVSAPSSARRINREMAKWSARLRNTVVLVYCIPGMTLDEKARLLGCAVRTVNERIALAHVALREALGEFRHMQTNGYIQAT